MQSGWRQVHVRLGELACVAVGPQCSVTPTDVHVVLCHGYGAPTDDLVPLVAETVRRLPPEDLAHVRFLFPGAPQQAEGSDGAAWWQHSAERRRAVDLGHQPAEGARRQEIPEGLPRARRQLMAALDAYRAMHHVTMDRVVLGGFSQGAMLATDTVLRLEEPPALLCVLSGTLIMETQWAALAPRRAGLSVVMSHGQQDPLLPFGDALALRDLLDAAGWHVGFVPFEGGHSIAPGALDLMAARLHALTSVQPAAPA